MLSMHQEPEELSFFQKLCDAISRLILRHPTEAAARREAYRSFYENMQKNIDQLDQVSHSRPAEEYEAVRNRQLRDQREAERLAEEERMRLEQEALEKAEQERLAAEEKARMEREEAERKAQFENLDQPEPAYEVSQAVLDEEAFMEETNKKSDEDLVRIQIQTLQDKISLAEISLKQLPTMRTVYDRQIKEGEENLKIISSGKILHVELKLKSLKLGDIHHNKVLSCPEVDEIVFEEFKVGRRNLSYNVVHIRADISYP